VTSSGDGAATLEPVRAAVLTMAYNGAVKTYLVSVQPQ
jgi:hypothetical protein